MTDKKQEHQQDPATGKGKAKKGHFRLKPAGMYFRWHTIRGLEAHVRELKQTIANLENKLYTYEKRNNDSQSGNEQPADH